MAKEIDFTFQLILVAALGAFLCYLYTNRSNSFFPNTGELVTENFEEDKNFVCPTLFNDVPKDDKVYHPKIGELPADEADLWAQTNPTGQGALAKKNFLDSGYMASQIEMVGQNRVTMNTGLRSEPIIPQYHHSVWRQTLFEPTDIEQRILKGTDTC